MNIEDIKLELVALQKLDTQNAINYGAKSKSDWFNQIITNEEFIKEIKQILSNQSHLGINQDFVESFLEIFKRHRHYSEGPGSEKSLTKYGRV